MSQAVPGKFLGILGQDPSVSKSNQLHVDIFHFYFIHSRHVLLYGPLQRSITIPKSPTSTGYFSHSGVVYTMDHEVVPRRCKRVDWLMVSSHDNFGLHHEKNGRGTMEVEVSKIQFSRKNKCTNMVQRVLQ